MKQCSSRITVRLKHLCFFTADPCWPAVLCRVYYNKVWSYCRSLRSDSSVRWQICSPQGKLLEGKLPRGEVHTVVNAVCLHYKRFKADVPCLQLCQKKKKKIQLLHCVSSENIYQKGLNNICVNQNCQCTVMIFVRVSEMTCKCWAAALKWGFCAVSLWAIKCQLFIPLLLGRRHEQMCGGRWIDSDRRNFSARFSHIMHTRR